MRRTIIGATRENDRVLVVCWGEKGLLRVFAGWVKRENFIAYSSSSSSIITVLSSGTEKKKTTAKKQTLLSIRQSHPLYCVGERREGKKSKYRELTMRKKNTMGSDSN
jgi:hypothetical protein